MEKRLAGLGTPVLRLMLNLRGPKPKRLEARCEAMMGSKRSGLRLSGCESERKRR